MLWIVVSVLAYFLFAVVALLDKYLLAGPIGNPKVYVFYVGLLGALAALLIPFIDFNFPGLPQLILSFLSGGLFLWGLFWFFKGLQLFEPSRIVPAVGGILPVFTFLIVLVISSGKELPSLLHIGALAALIAGGVLISYERGKKIPFSILKISLVAAFLLALSFVSSKYVYLAQSFWQGLIWMNLGGFFAALFFILAKGVRDELFKMKEKVSRKTAVIFISNQAIAALAAVLQKWAVFLAPLAYVAMVNALQGVQYVFLLIVAALLSIKFPQILKEEFSKEVVSQKIAAILLVGGGLILLTF